MRVRLVCLAGLAVMLGFVFTGVASANTTLGLAAPPSGSTTYECTGGPPYPTLVQSAQDPSTPYFVPSGGGAITQWQTNVTGDTPGAPITFAVVEPASGGDYTVVGADSETIPNPLPASGVATFTLSSPIAVAAGDTFALYSSSTGVNCYFFGGSTPTGDNIVSIDDAAPPPSTGQTLTTPVPCGSGCTLDVAATLVTIQDAAVTTSAGPAGASAGQTALLSSTVTNNGPASEPITFTDSVPSGLKIDSAVAADGACAVSGQTVTCAISGLSVGQSAPVDVLVTPSAAGSYTNHVSVGVAPGFTDPNAANNTASATLTVRLSLPAKCVVPSLKGLASGTAKTVLKDLGCKVKTAKAHSKSVRKGSVVKTKPGRGTYAYQRAITLIVSSGPKKKHHRQ